MTADQITIFAILGGSMVLFLWGKFRHDVVAVIAMITTVLLIDAVDAEEAWHGFGHPAVVLVACVLIIGRALQNSGVIDYLARRLYRFTGNEILHILALCFTVAVISGFMSNTGAVALMMPVAAATCRERGRSPAWIMMPLAFASLLGGLITLIGTPPNIIISGLRHDMEGKDSFAMFDFAPVGIALVMMGLIYLCLCSRFLIPKAAASRTVDSHGRFSIKDYSVEAKVLSDCPFIGSSIRVMETESHVGLVVTGIITERGAIERPNPLTVIREGQILMLEGNIVRLEPFLEEARLELLTSAEVGVHEIKSGKSEMVEAVIRHGSLLEGRRPRRLRMRGGGLVRLLGISRASAPVTERLRHHTFKAGDVLLLQGESEAINEVMYDFNLLPLEQHRFAIGRIFMMRRSVLVFLAAIVASLFGVSLLISFPLAVLVYLAMGVLPLRELYTHIDWPVVVLLGCMMPVGWAMERTDATQLIAEQLISFSEGAPPFVMLGLLMLNTMLLSNFINNAATALIMGPIGIGVAQVLGADPDAFLMAVAVGASSPFLTPIGHQCNTLVMSPGGYRFGDYWRLGLPLQILVVVTSVPMILWLFPL